ncbi:PID-CTERM protein-sorting domain-containing protein [Hymenobacter sp.]|uniref:PID-CTERM protein-sorting domain-containing protein n=1 Tax=Hymenobacter sp. TaxID=1898978 RepID=UPI00286D08CB|nr:hypothetical protein [Hymenobacter sp.]
MKKHTLVSALCSTALLVVISAAVALAQPGTGGPGPDPVPPVDPNAVPIDGGASLLLASGVALGLKKLRDRRKAQAR